MAGHVDDFHLAGNENSPRWQEIKLSIDTRYRWGTAKLNSYRHAGTDLEIVEDPAHGRYPVVDQSFYIEKEITACPASRAAQAQHGSQVFQAASCPNLERCLCCWFR